MITLTWKFATIIGMGMDMTRTPETAHMVPTCKSNCMV